MSLSSVVVLDEDQAIIAYGHAMVFPSFGNKGGIWESYRRSRLAGTERDEQGLTPPSIPAHLDEEPTYALQWKGVPFTSDEVQVIHAVLHL